MNTPTALALIGPTASGKTALALALAEDVPLEIISMDSALVYRGMDIGTAKPSKEEQSAVAHHLIDIRKPTETYSAAEFVEDCVKQIAEIRARGKLPLIVGGTMMYYHALTTGLSDLPTADENVRQHLRLQKEKFGLASLYTQLQCCDPITAARLKAGDSQRIERALEVFLISGKPLSAQIGTASVAALPHLKTLALLPEPRTMLHVAIAERFHKMLAAGFLDEMRTLQQQYPTLHPDLPSMRSVGYRQAWLFLSGKIDQKTFIEQGITATRQLAKRQITWLRRFNHIDIVNPFDEKNHALECLRKIALLQAS